MNPILHEIIMSGKVTDGTDKFPLHSHMSADEGAIIAAAFSSARPDTSLEVGFAYGISTLFACDALRENGKPATHHVVDPFQHEEWGGIGLRNVRAAGYGDLVKHHEVASEIALPRFLESGLRIQAAIIDGWHTFDHTLVDFFYVNKMLDVGGIVVLDDTSWPSVRKCAEHILSYPCYQLFAETHEPAASPLGQVRRSLARVVRPLRRPWDQSSAMAFQKVAPDERTWSWHVPF